jgi:hypothetical protein
MPSSALLPLVSDLILIAQQSCTSTERASSFSIFFMWSFPSRTFFCSFIIFPIYCTIYATFSVLSCFSTYCSSITGSVSVPSALVPSASNSFLLCTICLEPSALYVVSLASFCHCTTCFNYICPLIASELSALVSYPSSHASFASVPSAF